MKCHFLGFRFEFGPGIPPDKVYEEVVKLSAAASSFQGRRRCLLAGMIGDYLVGRWATLKGRSSFVVADTSTLEMATHELPEGYEITSPNYFVLHTKTLHGLYLKYPQSTPMDHFGDFLRAIARAVAKPLRQAESDDRKTRRKGAPKLSPDQAKQAAAATRKAADERFAVNFYPLIRREKLEELLATWKEIRGFRFQLATVSPSQDQFGPLAPHTRLEVRELRFEKEADPKGLGTKIAEMVGWLHDKFRDRARRASLIGRDQWGGPRTIDLGKFVDRFGEGRVKELLTDSELAITNVVDSQVLKRMIDEADSRPELFHLTAK